MLETESHANGNKPVDVCIIVVIFIELSTDVSGH